MKSVFEIIREYAVYGLSVLRRRRWIVLLSVATAILLAALAIQFTPTKYVAKSLILLQSANRSAMGFGAGAGSLNVVEQVRAIEAWVKSDEVLLDLLPRLSDTTEPRSPAELDIAMRVLRASLVFELVGNAALEVRLEGAKAAGLGNKLEIVLSRMMEGLTGPEQSILSAQQFKLVKYTERVKATEAALDRAIEAAGLQGSHEIRSALKQLAALSREPETALLQSADEASLRSAISDDPATVAQLVTNYAAYQEASENFSALQAQVGGGRGNYVGIFDSPDNLLIIGRPKDPIMGERSARRFALLGIVLALGAGGALILVLELMSGLLRTRGDYERVSGLPVLARLAKCDGEKCHAAV